MTVFSRFALSRPAVIQPPGVLPELTEEAAAPQAAVAPDRLDEDAALQAFQRRILDAKVRLHRRLIDEINLAAVEKATEAELREMVRTILSEYVLGERLPLNADEFETLLH